MQALTTLMGRRGRVAVAIGLSTALLMTGCSAEEPDNPDSSPSPAETSATSESADTATGIFEELLAEHREVDFDPGDEATAEETYAVALADNLADFSDCQDQKDPEKPDCERPASLTEDLEETINVELLLDASGSMADAARGGTKMRVAQRVLADFVETLPEDANVSLRIFGQEGSGSGADKARSCRSTEQRVPFMKANSPRVAEGIRSVEPAGWTPLGSAMEAARSDLAKVGKRGSSNFVYVLSDGIETCGGNPVAAAKRLAKAGVGVDVNIVGFDVDRKAGQQLAQAAKAAGGKYADASDTRELTEAFAGYDWLEWTKYRNCVTAKAYGDYNDVSAVAYGNYNCVSAAIYRESNNISAEAYRESNDLSTAAYRESNAIRDVMYDQDGDYDSIENEDRAAVLELSRERRDALIEVSKANRDYTVEQSKERRDIILKAAKTQRTDLLDDAYTERDRLLEEAEKADAVRDSARD